MLRSAKLSFTDVSQMIMPPGKSAIELIDDVEYWRIEAMEATELLEAERLQVASLRKMIDTLDSENATISMSMLDRRKDLPDGLRKMSNVDI